MANEFASNVGWSINSATQGNKRLRKVDDYDVSDGASKEAMPEVGSADPVGFIFKPGPKTITFTIREAKLVKPEVDWEYLKRNDENFSLTRRVFGGVRAQYVECQVSTVSVSGDNQGTHTIKVEIIALRVERL